MEEKREAVQRTRVYGRTLAELTNVYAKEKGNVMVPSSPVIFTLHTLLIREGTNTWNGRLEVISNCQDWTVLKVLLGAR